MSDSSGSTAWTYDIRGRATKEMKTISDNTYVTEWGYNSADLNTWMKYPDGEIVNYDYNSRMLLNSVAGNANYVQSTTYDLTGRMTQRVLGNNVASAYNYFAWDALNGVGKLQSAAHTKGASTLQSFAYAYDAVGNIKTINDSVTGEVQTFGYDSLDRLTSAVAANGLANYNETYGYDGTTGNLSNKAGTTYAYDANHKHAVASLSSGNTYDYDANGNQTVRHVGNDVFNLAYDAENRLVEVKKNGNVIAQFVYDGDGKRVKSVAGSETTLFVGSHYEVKGSEISKYYFAGSARIAVRKYVIPQSMNVEYLVGDHLGSTSLTTDSAGEKVSEIRYKAWGEVRYSWTNASLNTTPSYKLTPYQFTGQYAYTDDPITPETEGFGLMFYNARFYDPSLSRFISADTIVPGGVQGLDRYAYVGNNPVRYADPSGHCRMDASMDECFSSVNQARARDLVQSAIDNPDKPIYGKYAIKAIANLYGIKLAPGDHWEYEKSLYEILVNETGIYKTKLLGTAPRYPNDNLIYDIKIENGKIVATGEQVPDETAVYITEAAFTECSMKIECIAAVIAHEATHSWIESVSDPNTPRNEFVISQEEIIANQVAESVVGDYLPYETPKTTYNPFEVVENYNQISIDLSITTLAALVTQ